MDSKQQHHEGVYNLAGEFEIFDDPRVMKLIYDYKVSQAHAYEMTVMEIAQEYKKGIIDPSRIVGKIEIKGGRTRKKIEDIKKTFGNNASNQVRSINRN